MDTNYNPIQKLNFYFKKSEGKLYVKSSIIVSIKPTEYLEKYNTPSLVNSSATIIQYLAISDGAPINIFTEKILLKENVSFNEVSIVQDLKQVIKTDMSQKKIFRYSVTVSINQSDSVNTDDGQTTTTISEDDIIEIE